jgi:rhamnosyl/mannosyltransferase
MKVLIVSKYFYPVFGGVETNAFYVAKELVKKGNEVTVIASGDSYSRERIKGVHVIRVPTWLTIGPTPISPGVFNEILGRDFDIANLHDPNPSQNFFAYLALRLKRKPFVVTYHSDIEPHTLSIKLLKFFYVNLFQRFFLLRKARKIMPTSPQYIDLSDILPKFRHKCEIVPNGVDLSFFKPLKSKKGSRILFVGRLIYYKGLQYLIKALPEILEKVPDAKLAIVGDGPLKAEWTALAKRLKVNDRIEWLGKLSDKDMLKQYQKCDVFVLPSIYKTEAFGIVLLEAMACGKPCVGTNISGTEYVLEDSGIAVDPQDEEQLSTAVVRVLTDRKLAEEMSRKGLKKISGFDWPKIADKVFKTYKEALK